MASELNVYLCRHGETEWTVSRQHTSRTDIPLTAEGERQAESFLKPFLKTVSFSAVYTSPLKRALSTCKAAGYEKGAVVDPDLAEWDYGDYEGMTSQEIKKKDPSWNLFENGGPNGETPEQALERAHRFFKKIESAKGNIALFSHGHFLRVLAVSWLGCDISMGKHLPLSVASVSILGFEHENPAIRVWNGNGTLCDSVGGADFG